MDDLFSYEHIQRFSETELAIYKYIVANREKAAYLTIRELARENFVSTATILRFCEKTGCGGYSEFKEKIRGMLGEKLLTPPGGDVEEILQYFKRTCTGAFEEMIEKAVAMIRQADRVYFVGMGASGTLGAYGARYFSNLGKFSSSIEDPYYPLLQDMQGNVLVIALSVSGESGPIIDLLQNFRSHNCKILSITNHSGSTIARMADRNISYHLAEKRTDPYCNLTTQVPVIFLIEILARRIF